MELSHTTRHFSRRISIRTFVLCSIAGHGIRRFSLLKLRWSCTGEPRSSATLQQIITAIQRRWGVRALRRLGQPGDDAIAVIPTGFADLDHLLGIGGIPRGRITEFLGTPTSGMSTIVLTLLAQAQAAGDI